MHSQTEQRVKWRPRVHQPSMERVRDVLIISFDKVTQGQGVCSRRSCPLLPPFVCGDSDGQRPRDLQLQNACISNGPRQSLHQSVSLSVSPSLSQYNDSLPGSQVLMPIGYLCRLSHAFIYEFSRFHLGRGLIGLSDLSFCALTQALHQRLSEYAKTCPTAITLRPAEHMGVCICMWTYIQYCTVCML